ncbi:Aste57867_22559 [Aphanomyces stellatus]|uniref:Aste57867_22559 protein n=1 Tax=Aphanomyces stellatus TaxID=120398 RepID=A0A485LKN7_9STRA|nr:hypothetical protein As57867_022489 [Aphanomyces stellatus]VFT99218.1 Aste57867_22559 [Aphanomyces stellatus]
MIKLQAIVRGNILRRFVDRQSRAAYIMTHGLKKLYSAFRLTTKGSYLALKLQALYRGYKIREELSTVIHILALKRGVRKLYFAARHIQTWTRSIQSRRRYLQAMNAAVCIEKWMRRMLSKLHIKKSAAAAIVVQAAARGFLVRNNLTHENMQVLLGIMEKEVEEVNGQEVINAIAHNRKVLNEESPHSQHIILSFQAKSNVLQMYKTSWMIHFSDLRSDLLTQGRHISSLELGETHTVALTNHGEIYTFGWNDKGQLGCSTKVKCSSKPMLLSPVLFQMATVSQVVVGDDHTLALTHMGSVYSWGGNRFGQLGLGHFQDRPTPQKLSFSTGNNRRAISISAGSCHSLTLLETGSVFQWGNLFQDNTMSTNMALPKLLKVRPAVKFRSISSGVNFSVALCVSGKLYSWGDGSNGQLGLGEAVVQVQEPTKISIASERPRDLVRFNRVVCGAMHALAVSECGGFIYVWGSNQTGQVVIRAILSFLTLLSSALQLDPNTKLTPTSTVVVANQKGTRVHFSWGYVGHVIPFEDMADDLTEDETIRLTKSSNVGPIKLLQCDDMALELACAWSTTMNILWTTFTIGQKVLESASSDGQSNAKDYVKVNEIQLEAAVDKQGELKVAVTSPGTRSSVDNTKGPCVPKEQDGFQLKDCAAGVSFISDCDDELTRAACVPNEALHRVAHQRRQKDGAPESIIAGITGLINIITLNITGALVSIYVIVFGALFLLFECRLSSMETRIRRNFGFLYSYKGRAAFIFFIGFLDFGMKATLGTVAGVFMCLNALLNLFIMLAHPEFKSGHISASSDPTTGYTTGNQEAASYLQANPQVAMQAGTFAMSAAVSQQANKV